jgi:serine/threonine protein kinase
LAVGRRIATGGFGSVFRATLARPGEAPRAVILKKATEFGPAEAWMNERCFRGRTTRKHVASFVAAFDEADGDLEEEEEEVFPSKGGRKKKRRAGPAAAADGGPLWLVWEDEGGVVLSDLLARRDWPACAEPFLLGRRPPRLPPGPRRRAAGLKALATQLFEALEALHGTGIVHRDVKPQNLILLGADAPAQATGALVEGGRGAAAAAATSPPPRSLKLIDLGAAADLRVGINYTPNEVRTERRKDAGRVARGEQQPAGEGRAR